MKIVRWQIFFILVILAFVSAAQADFKNEEDNQSLQSRVYYRYYGRQIEIFCSSVIFFVTIYCFANLIMWGGPMTNDHNVSEQSNHFVELKIIIIWFLIVFAVVEWEQYQKRRRSIIGSWNDSINHDIHTKVDIRELCRSSLKLT